MSLPASTSEATDLRARRSRETTCPATTRGERAILIAQVAAVIAPLLIGALVVTAGPWHPAGDVALGALRVDDVGGAHTPLVGAWSRWGWAHPGPLMFWALAPFTWILGNDGLVIGVAVIASASAATAVVVAQRRAGPLLSGLLALALVSSMLAMGVEQSVDPWNPYVAFFPFVLFVVLVWSVTSGGRWSLPWAAAVGSFCVQCHVGYTPLVVGLGVLALVWAMWPEADSGGGDGRQRLQVLGAALGALLVCWLPALVEQATNDPGNLTAIVDYATGPGEAVAGWGTAWEIANLQLGLSTPWTGGTETDVVNDAGGTSVPWTAAAVTAVAAMLVLAVRGRRRAELGWAAVSLTGIALGLVSTSRLTGQLEPYLVRWWWAVSLFTMVGLVWALVGVGLRRTARSDAAPIGQIVVVTVSAAAVLVGVGSVATGDATSSDDGVSLALDELEAPTVAALDPDRSYLVRADDPRNWGAMGPGLLLMLEQAGFDVFAPREEHAELQYGEWRLAEEDAVDGVLHVVALERVDPATGVDGRELARWDPLSPAEREELRVLDADIRRRVRPQDPFAILAFDSPLAVALAEDAEVPRAWIDRFNDLHDRGRGFVVYEEST